LEQEDYPHKVRPDLQSLLPIVAWCDELGAFSPDNGVGEDEPGWRRRRFCKRVVPGRFEPVRRSRAQPTVQAMSASGDVQAHEPRAIPGTFRDISRWQMSRFCALNKSGIYDRA
jgi:hypothetical protein